MLRVAVEIEFDPEKEAANLAKHEVSLARAADLQVEIFERVRPAFKLLGP